MEPKRALDWDTLLGPYRRAVARLRDLASEDPGMPDNFGPLDASDGHARITGPCGDTMEYWLRVSGPTVVRVTYVTDGCWTSIASGSTAARLAEGRSVDEAALIEQEDVLRAMGGLPPEAQHCALLAANTLKAAIADYCDRSSGSAVG